MTKIDKRHVYGIMLDTETANTLSGEDGKLDMSCVLPYDFGFAVIDTYGRIYDTFSFVNSDIFYGEKDLMASAYYAKKISKYEKDISEGKRIVKNTYEINQFIKNIINQYNCKFVCCHNAFFDLTACNNIVRWTTKSKYRYFFPYGIEIWDTMKMAQDVICTTDRYKRYCKDNNYLTKTGQVKRTAEVLYRYISGEQEFNEEHTGLEDVLIEVKILEYCKRQHKKMRKCLFNKK